MALVKAGQSFVLEGFAEIKEKEHWWCRAEYVRKQIRLMSWVDAFCDETEVSSVIEEKIQKLMKSDNGWGRNFEGWTSYRKYYKPGELSSYPDGKKAELQIEYIRDWKMEKIMKELDGNLFAVLCKELGISGGEAIARG